MAKSTGKQCKHHVAVAGETSCPIHGGKSKSNASPIPQPQQQQDKQQPQQQQQCAAICQSTKLRCQGKVSLASEQNCPRHGGLTKHGVAMKPPRWPIPWVSIHATSVEYLLTIHPRSCKCNNKKRICTPMLLIAWLQRLAALVGQRNAANGGRATYPTPGALKKWMAQAPPNLSNDDIVTTAVNLFGASNVVWLGALFPSSTAADQDEEEEEEDHDDDQEHEESDEDIIIDSQAKRKMAHSEGESSMEQVVIKKKPATLDE